VKIILNKLQYMQTVRYSFKISNFSVTMTMRFYEQNLPTARQKKNPQRHTNNKIMYSMCILLIPYHNFKFKYR
jgi:hypothetical protein